jgi:ADP-ribose pyrophosphatase YjhB (NUDIX family)
MRARMNFCSYCGSDLQFVTPAGDNRARYVCEKCNTIHYQNPKIVAGCIAHWQDKILLCRRSIDPRYGLWTLPAGFMENGETSQDAAARESWEEAHAKIEQQKLFGIFNLPHISQVYMMFCGKLSDGKASPGDESLEVALYSEQEIPWNELAFPVIVEALQLYFSDRSKGEYRVHLVDIVKDEQQNFKITRY